MAKGYPDFFGQSIFMKYGPYEHEAVSVTAELGVKKEVLKVEAKGILQGGRIVTLDSDAVKTDIVYLDIDGVNLITDTWYNLLTQVYDLHTGAPFVLTCYDEDAVAFALQLRSGISFEDSVILSYTGGAAVIVTVWGTIDYQAVAQ